MRGDTQESNTSSASRGRDGPLAAIAAACVRLVLIGADAGAGLLAG